MEEPIRFGESGAEMNGILHAPVCKTDYPKPAVVLCHGFRANKVGPHRIFVKLARKLAANGIVVFRFDYRGSGDSSGDFADSTISSQIKDVFTAIEYVSQLEMVNQSQLGLLGLSLGGAIAATVAGRSERIKALVLWSAVADLEEMLAVHQPEGYSADKLEEQGYIDFEGFKLSSDFIVGMNQIQPLVEIDDYNQPVFLVHGSEDEVVPVNHTEQYYDTVSSEVCQKHIIVGADHTYNQLEWESEALERTEQWLIENM
ncbi:MAG: alpha/beta hydrolase [Bacillota bacterium]